VKTTVALLAIAVALFVAAPAHAGWRVDRSLAIAEAVWKPACGKLSLAYGNCTIWIDASKSFEFEALCSAVLHEAGHVTGAEHSSNPGSVMYAEPLVAKVTARIDGRTVVRWDGVDRRCLNRGRPFLERHDLL
jgi:hypothetical protein